MIRHFIKLAWNRKSTHLLLGLEILCAFLILVAVATSGISTLVDFRRPLGFEYRQVWSIWMNPGERRHHAKEDSAVMQQVYRTLKGLGQTVAVAEDGCPPFMGYNYTDRTEINGITVDSYLLNASDELDEVLRLDLVAGRWFDQSDDAAGESPVVINQSLARTLFGEEDPIGRMLISNPADQLRAKVVGVVSDHRYPGLFHPPFHFMAHRARLDRPGGQLQDLLVRVRPGTPRSFEQHLHEQLQAVTPGWTAEISSLEEARAESIRSKLEIYQVYGVLGGALLLLAALGLVGVLWQSVTQRTQEIGIRRATGAEARQIYAQFTGEMLVLTTVAVVLGVVLVLHSAVLDLFPGVSAGVYVAGLLSATVVLYLLVIAAALYPGWLATRIQPAQALHYE